jgi:hypothetical protein
MEPIKMFMKMSWLHTTSSVQIYEMMALKAAKWTFSTLNGVRSFLKCPYFFLSLWRNSLRIIEPEVLSPCSQKPSVQSYLESLIPSSDSYITSVHFHFNINLLSPVFSLSFHLRFLLQLCRYLMQCRRTVVTYSRYYLKIFRRNWGK